MTILADFKQINTFIFDVDGVLTDGNILVLENGEMARRMNVKDGFALQLAAKLGYKIFIVSGSSPSAVKQRLSNLGITEVYFKVKDKKKFILDLSTQYNFTLSKTLFMGDDMPDVPVLDIIGLSSCPCDAVPEIKSRANYISSKKGGEGCVRDVIEKVLKLNDHWNNDIQITST